jgi:hypothetical protein
MLRELGKQVGIDDVRSIMSDEAEKDLILLSGGVPRDYLNIFVGGLERAAATPKRKNVTPTDLRKAAAALSNETKLKDLRTDAGSEVPALEALFVDIVKFCLSEKRKTAFLVSLDQKADHADAHELIQQLMDFKLIHLVEPSTSAASGRPGRYEAYTLDFALFMEPRKRQHRDRQLLGNRRSEAQGQAPRGSNLRPNTGYCRHRPRHRYSRRGGA